MNNEKSRKRLLRWWQIALPLLVLSLPIAFGLLVQTANASVHGVPLSGGPISKLSPQDTSTPTPTVTSIACGAAWRIVSSPSSGPNQNVFNGVAAVSANDVWAVGLYYPTAGQFQTLVEHWDSSQWSVVSSPNIGSVGDYLNGVATVSANDVWAVGSSFIASLGAFQTLIEHWDGSQWSVVASPSPGSGSNNLDGVAVVSANDVWAVGYYYVGSVRQTLVEHWNGSQWSVVPSPNIGSTGNILNGVTVVSANDVWAVGYYLTPGTLRQTLTEHWDGSQWSVVASPNATVGSTYLNGVAAVSAGDVWAVGEYYNGGVIQTLAEHWNGTSWSIVTSPNIGSSSNYLDGVAAVSANDVWAVGHVGNSNQTLAEHWNGTSWSIVTSPSPSSGSSLNAVEAVSSNDLWAVGSAGVQTLVQRYNDPCGKATPTNTVTSTVPIITNSPTRTNTPTPTAIPTVCGAAWRLVSSPNPGSGYNYLNGVAAVSAIDVWAVGYANNPSTQTLIEHWNGSQWSVVPSPNVGSGINELNGVAAVSAKDVWAVGSYVSGSSRPTLIEHWDGSQWSIVSTPGTGSDYNYLNGVEAISANDVWAVGIYVNNILKMARTLTEHWDGSKWSIVPSLSPDSGFIQLNRVAADSANDVWAVGDYYTGGVYQTLIEHWNGLSWSIVSSPNVGTGNNQLNGVAALSANDVWAVGYYQNADLDNTLMEHWNGTQWSVVSTPGLFGYLYGVAAVSANDVWATGYSSDGTLAVHWNGSQWSVVSSDPGSFGYLYGVAAIAGNDVWAAGIHNISGEWKTLVEHYNNPCATPAPTNTPNATQTPCPISFIDVHSTDYFYVPVQYLFCRGVIGGYGTEFRPYNNTSRGQLSKIVTLGFSLPINTTGGPHFTDVPTSNVFYPYVETAYNGNIVSGYGTEFRPNDNVSRGQLSKIVVLTAGWQLRTPFTATFTDVPVGSTFFSYVETAYCHGIVSGYGTLFKPNDPATRGQICKIVYLALTSTTGCP